MADFAGTIQTVELKSSAPDSLEMGVLVVSQCTRSYFLLRGYCPSISDFERWITNSWPNYSINPSGLPLLDVTIQTKWNT